MIAGMSVSGAVGGPVVPFAGYPAHVLVADVSNPYRVAESRTTKYVEVGPLHTLAEVLPKWRHNQNPEHFVTTLNGGLVAPDKRDEVRVRPGDHVGVLTRPLDPVTASIVTGLVVGAIAASISATIAWDAGKRAKIQAHHAARRAHARAQQMGDSYTYGWEGIRNAVTPGGSIPVLYGRHRVGGTYVYAETRAANANGRSILDGQLVISEGEVEGLEAGTVEFNDAPSSDYGSDISVASVNGTAAQTAMTGILPRSVVRTRNQPGNVFDPTGASPTLYVTEPGRTALRLYVTWPDGLYGVLGSANFAVNQGWWQFTFQVRVRSFPSGSFGSPLTFTSPMFLRQASGGAGSGSGALLYGTPWIPPTFPMDITGLTKGRYEVEIKVSSIFIQLQDRSTNPATQHILSATGWPNTPPTNKRIVLSQVEEFNENPSAYPGLAVLGFSAMSSSKLGGGLPKVTGIWKGIKPRVYTVAPGTEISSGTGTAGAGTDTLTDTGATFQTDGVEAGDRVFLTTGDDINEYLVDTVPSETSITVTDEDGNAVSFSGGSATYSIEDVSGTYTNTYSRNPVWVILDILANDRYGGGALNTYEDDFLIDSFISVASFCDTLVSRGLDDSNPIDSSASSGSTIGGTNLVRFSGGGGLDADVKVDDTLKMTGGADTGSYRIDSIASDGSSCRVSTTTGGTVTFSGSVNKGWQVNATERLAQCDHYFDGTTNAWEAALAVARNARIAIVRSGGKIKLIADDKSAVVQIFSMGNIIEGSFTMEHLGQLNVANRVEIQFLDEDKNWTQQVADIEDPDALTNGEPILKVQSEAFGVTRLTQALRIAKYHWLSNREQRRQVSFEVAAEGLALEVFDVFKLAHDVYREYGDPSGSALPSGRVRRVTASTIELDQPVPNDTTYFYEIRKQDDTLTSVTPAGGGGTVTVFTVPADHGIEPGDPWLADKLFVDNPSQIQWRVTSITRGHHQRRRITAVEYNPDFYEDNGTGLNDHILDIGAFPVFNG